MREQLIKSAKSIFNAILVFGSLAGAALAVVQLYVYIEDKPIEYNEPSIPLAYEDSRKFQEFLDKNTGKTVKFKTEISFDFAIGINQLIHKACNYDKILNVIGSAPSKIEKTAIGLPEFREGFTGKLDSFPYDNINENMLSKVSCYNTILIKTKDPSRLRLSHGGTGIVTLPFHGLFTIERRHFSGPSKEYTLREN